MSLLERSIGSVTVVVDRQAQFSLFSVCTGRVRRFPHWCVLSAGFRDLVVGRYTVGSALFDNDAVGAGYSEHENKQNSFKFVSTAN